jgi:cell division septation protein DedD
LVEPEQGVGDQTITPREKTYGLHVSSWRDREIAAEQCEKLRKQGFATWINQVDLGDKGVWYRVLVGEFGSVKEAQAERPDVLAILSLDSAPVFERAAPSPVISAQL